MIRLFNALVDKIELQLITSGDRYVVLYFNKYGQERIIKNIQFKKFFDNLKE